MDTPLEDLTSALATLPQTKQSVALLLIALRHASVDHGNLIYQRLGSLVIDRELESLVRSMGRRRPHAERAVQEWWVKNRDRLVYDDSVGAFVLPGG